MRALPTDSLLAGPEQAPRRTVREYALVFRDRSSVDMAPEQRYSARWPAWRTGRLVTSAALILFLAFAALGSGPSTDLRVMAPRLGFGILLDATLVRALLPALISLFGKWNWYLPTRPRPDPANTAVPPGPDNDQPGSRPGTHQMAHEWRATHMARINELARDFAAGGRGSATTGARPR